MKRRNFLLTSASALLASGQGMPAFAQAPPMPAAIVITDISAQTSRHSLIGVVSTFLQFGIAPTCCLTLPATEVVGGPLKEILKSLRLVAGQLELAVNVPNLQELTPYFQARTTFEARARLSQLAERSDEPLMFKTVLCEEVDSPNGPTGLRASGIRNVLVQPTSSQKVSSETWPSGVVRFSGGQIVSPDELSSKSVQAVHAENRRIYYLSAKSFDGFSEVSLFAWASDFAKTLLEQEMSGKLALMAVSDMQLRDSFAFSRSIAVLLNLPNDADETVRLNIKKFVRQLRNEGIPSAIKPIGSTFWVSKTSEGTTLVPISAECVRGRSAHIKAETQIAPGYGVRLVDEQSDTFGIDGCALIRLPLHSLPNPVTAESTATHFAGGRDLVLMISPKQITTPAARRLVKSGLKALAEDGLAGLLT